MYRVGIYIVMLLAIVSKSYCQSLTLGVDSSYALFTSTGAFNNNGTTLINGNIGTNGGEFTGFPPGTVDGQIHVIDSESVQAATDVENAYNNLSSMTCDSVLGTTLGNNQVLTPNIYCIGNATTINGKLILNAQGNPNAVFVFLINGAFATTALSQITLENAASLSNVYWQINGAVILGDSSIFRGTIVANGAISLLERAILYGRGLTRAGAIELHDNMIEGLTPLLPLPIQLLYFNARQEYKNILLNWSTASETNNEYFSILRSKDGISFEAIKQIVAIGTSNSISNYSAVDNNPFDGISYYQLKQTDINGDFTYSDIVSVSVVHPIVFSMYPNPCATYLKISLQDVFPITVYTLKLFNVQGIEIFFKNLNQPLTNIDMSVVPTGVYIYQLLSNEKPVQSGTLYINR